MEQPAGEFAYFRAITWPHPTIVDNRLPLGIGKGAGARAFGNLPEKSWHYLRVELARPLLPKRLNPRPHLSIMST